MALLETHLAAAIELHVRIFPILSLFGIRGYPGGGSVLCLVFRGARSCRKISSLISGRHDIVNARIAGVREALASSRIEPDPDWVHIGALDNKSFVRSLVAGCQPDAFICANDHTAALLLHALGLSASMI